MKLAQLCIADEMTSELWPLGKDSRLSEYVTCLSVMPEPVGPGVELTKLRRVFLSPQAFSIFHTRS